jgi:hypothetical protein
VLNRSASCPPTACRCRQKWKKHRIACCPTPRGMDFVASASRSLVDQNGGMGAHVESLWGGCFRIHRDGSRSHLQGTSLACLQRAWVDLRFVTQPSGSVWGAETGSPSQSGVGGRCCCINQKLPRTPLSVTPLIHGKPSPLPCPWCGWAVCLAPLQASKSMSSPKLPTHHLNSLAARLASRPENPRCSRPVQHNPSI